VLDHNHPSGDITPSSDDRAVTGRIAAAGAVMGIELLDHLIVSADGGYVSFKETGLL
jgi:DNA repair protein RadC